MTEHNGKTAALCYLSPQGTTRQVGRKVSSLLQKHGFDTREYDLSCGAGTDSIRSMAKQAGEASLLVVGTPVYADHAVYPVVSFLEELPDGEGKPALAYFTFGGVSVGGAPFQVTDLLRSRGYSVKGVATVLCVHSMMFGQDDPVGGGHPDESDWSVVREWIDAVADRLEPNDDRGLDIDRMRPGTTARLLNSTVFNMRFMKQVQPTIRFNRDRCTECGNCVKRCPVGRLDSLPKLSRKPLCLHCYECVRVCPEGAFNARMSMSYPVIRFFSKMAGRKGDMITRYRV